MTHSAEIRRILVQHLRDAGSSFSIGSLGAIAEFHRSPDEPFEIDESESLAVVTERGALRIALREDVTPLAYEALSARPGRWQHGVVFCLPNDRALARARSTLTELGPDTDAIHPVERGATLFDMGLSARNVDFCVRTRDPALLATLRDAAGRSLLSAGGEIMNAIIDASPHRVAISALARMEVYQAIGRTRTPQGPHTHVLPRFLRSGRTHSANVPVPEGLLPCLSLYPSNPLLDELGREKEFDTGAFEAFGALLDRWGSPAYRAEKDRVVAMLRRGSSACDYVPPASRIGRTAMRVALRQYARLEPGSAVAREWRARFDPPRPRRRP